MSSDHTAMITSMGGCTVRTISTLSAHRTDRAEEVLVSGHGWAQGALHGLLSYPALASVVPMIIELV